METIELQNDIPVFYITATSFPAGIQDAQERLHKLVPFSINRKYFGLSRPENGHIVYRAAAEELKPGEGASFHCDSMLLQKGKYIATDIKDFIQNIPAIDRSFKELLRHPGIDPQGYCVEWYKTEKDVTCMVRLQ